MSGRLLSADLPESPNRREARLHPWRSDRQPPPPAFVQRPRSQPEETALQDSSEGHATGERKRRPGLQSKDLRGRGVAEPVGLDIGQAQDSDRRRDRRPSAEPPWPEHRQRLRYLGEGTDHALIRTGHSREDHAPLAQARSQGGAGRGRCGPCCARDRQAQELSGQGDPLRLSPSGLSLQRAGIHLEEAADHLRRDRAVGVGAGVDRDDGGTV